MYFEMFLGKGNLGSVSNFIHHTAILIVLFGVFVGRCEEGREGLVFGERVLYLLCFFF